jgi:hypothetical protein
VRSQAWRKAHPRYWQKRVRVGRYVAYGKLAAVIREFALQDMTDAHFCLVLGLVSHLARCAQQDTIAKEMRRLIVLGHGIFEQITSRYSCRRADRKQRANRR